MTIKVSRNRIDLGTIGMKNYGETVNALGNVTGAVTIDYSLGSVVTATATGNVTWTITNPPASGKAGSLTLILTSGGAYTQTWMSGVKWSGNIAPTLTTILASPVDVLSFFTIDGGATWIGALVMLNNS